MVLAGLCVVAAVAYVSRNSIAVAETTIRQELRLTLDQMGWVFSAFFWSYAFAQIPSGLVGHTRGSRRALSGMAALWSLAAAASGLAVDLVSLCFARLYMGAVQAGVFPCSARTIADWLPHSRRALASGLLGAFMSVGGAGGAALTGVLLEGFALPWLGVSVGPVSWRLLFAIYALPGLIWAAWFYLWFRDRPQEHPGVNAAELAVITAPRNETAAQTVASPDDAPRTDEKTDVDQAAGAKATGNEATGNGTPWGRALASFDLWMICGQQFFRAAGYAFLTTWFATYLQETRSVSIAEAGMLTSLPLLATVVGSSLGGVIVDAIYNRTGSLRLSRQLIGVIAMVGCALFIWWAYYVSDAREAVLLISAGSLFAALAGSAGYAVTIDKGGSRVAPIFGTMNMAGNLGAALCPIVVARFVKISGSWSLALLLFVGIYLAAAVCWLLINPNGTLFDEEDAS